MEYELYHMDGYKIVITIPAQALVSLNKDYFTVWLQGSAAGEQPLDILKTPDIYSFRRTDIKMEERGLDGSDS